MMISEELCKVFNIKVPSHGLIKFVHGCPVVDLTKAPSISLKTSGKCVDHNLIKIKNRNYPSSLNVSVDDIDPRHYQAPFYFRKSAYEQLLHEARVISIMKRFYYQMKSVVSNFRERRVLAPATAMTPLDNQSGNLAL